MSAMEENSEESDVESIFEGFEENEVGDDVSDIDVGNISVSDVESSDDELSDDADDGDLNWTDQFDDTFVVNDFREETGPQLPADFDVNTASPLDYFYLLFPLTLFVDIVAHTNNYAIWKMAQSGENDPKCTVHSKVHSKDGKRKETVYGCELCGVHLCKEGCHAKYHNTQ